MVALIALLRRRKLRYVALVAGLLLGVVVVLKQEVIIRINQQDISGHVLKLFEVPEDPWLELQRERRHRLQDVCLSEVSEYQGKFPQSLVGQLKVDDKHRVIYCLVPKAACTSWKSMFIRLSGAADVDPDHPEKFRHHVHNYSFLEKHGLKPLGSFPEKGIRERLTSYTKFIVVRHPFLRLHSAFQDKFRVFDAVGSTFQKHWGKEIIQLYRRNASIESLNTGQNATFEEFLRYLGDEAVPYSQKMEPHWTSLHALCHPCVFNYTYIATTETLEEDSANILDRVFNSSYRLQNLHKTGHTRSTAFDSIPKNIVDKLFPNYGVDLRMFGYKWPLDS